MSDFLQNEILANFFKNNRMLYLKKITKIVRRAPPPTLNLKEIIIFCPMKTMPYFSQNYWCKKFHVHILYLQAAKIIQMMTPAYKL